MHVENTFTPAPPPHNGLPELAAIAATCLAALVAALAGLSALIF